MSDATIALVGVGTMGEALLAGAIDGGLGPALVTAGARRQERADELSGRYGVAATTDAADAVRGVGIVIVAAVPGAVPGILDEIRDHLDPAAIVVSIADGVSLADLAEHLPGRPVVRAMPSLAAQVGRGVTLLTCSDDCTADQVRDVRGVFARSGDVLTVGEDEQPVLAPLSSGGPAYFFAVASAMVDAGQRRGMPRDRARRLVADALAGAAAWMDAGDDEPDDLVDRVCSPGGAGARRMAVLGEHGMREAILAALA